MKRILITNDDGHESLGLHRLAEALKPLGEVTVVAPSQEKSACGHSLTLTRPLHFISIDDNFYKLDDGTPTDCVFLALHKIFDEEHRPDIVISGINRGANMGEDITYSGTASAAMEAVLQGIPAIAISQVCRDSCQDIDALERQINFDVEFVTNLTLSEVTQPIVKKTDSIIVSPSSNVTDDVNSVSARSLLLRRFENFINKSAG